MRFLYFLILLIVVLALAVFAIQNNQMVSITYLDRSITSPMALLIAVVYLLGMVSGWTVVGLVKRSLQRVTERRRN